MLLGASRPEQVQENVASLDIVLSSSQQQRLDAAGALPPLNPYFIFDLPHESIFGVTDLRAWGEAS